MPTNSATGNSPRSSLPSRVLIPLLLVLAACSSDNGGKAEMQKALAYLNDDPTASSTDGVTFGDPNYWHTECKANTPLWRVAVDACNRGGGHPPVCEIIRNGCP